MLEEFNLKTEPLLRLAAIIRGADYSRMFKDDVAQLDAMMPVYDALYRWCRDGTEETHG